MAVDQFFDFEKEGAIKTRAAGSRVFFIATRGWAVIERRLFKVFSSGASVMLSEMGNGYGRGAAKEVMGYVKDPSVILQVLSELSAAAGWGVIEVRGDVQGGSSIDVVITRCAFCADGEKSHEPRCYFITGVTAGVASEAYGAAFRATESQCVRKGDPICLVHLERLPPSK